MTNKDLMIQLNFLDPRDVSIYSVSQNSNNDYFFRFVMILSWNLKIWLRHYF